MTRFTLRGAVPCVALLAGVALLVAGCGSTAPRTPSNAPRTRLVQIAYRSIAIAPANVAAHVGDTVRWMNSDATPHNVTSTRGPARFASPDFGKGGVYTYKLTSPGVITYVCTIHPASMVGRISVQR